MKPQAEQELETNCTIDITKFETLGGQPNSFIFFGIVKNSAIIIHFWAHKASRFPDSPITVVIQKPPSSAPNWIDQEKHQELIKIINEEVEQYWYDLPESNPQLSLVEFKKRPQKKLLLKITLAIISGRFVIRKIKRHFQPPE